jgi:uncharacterized repeat protein (TIGR01451 family)
VLGRAAVSALAALLLGLLGTGRAAAQTPAGTPIDNVAAASFFVGATPASVVSNTVSVTTLALTSPATLELLRYDPLASPSELLDVTPSTCGATPAPPPTDLSGAPIPLTSSVPLADAADLALDEAVFVRVGDADQNRDDALVETVDVTVTVAATGDSELLTLTETGPATGVFAGHSQLVVPAPSGDCALGAVRGALVVGDYVDPDDPSDRARDSAPVGEASASQFIAKRSNKTSVAVGDFVQYSLTVENPAAGGAPSGIEVVDRLPPGFRYRLGSTSIDDLPAGDPALSSDGRTLTFTLPPTSGPSRTSIRYATEVTSAAPLGRATNRAEARLVGASSGFVATASVEVQDDLQSSDALLMGQVVVGSCDDDVTNDDLGLAGVRVYLEDGTYSITDDRGMYRFEGVEPGVHVVQLDNDSLPAMYQVLRCERNTRFAGAVRSQFVDVTGGMLWRADFHVGLKPRAKGRLVQQLESSLDGDRLRYRFEIHSAWVPLRNVRGIVMLPPGVEYVPGSTRLDDEPFPDPTVNGGALAFALGDGSPGVWLRDLHFEAVVRRPAAEGDRLTSRSLVLFDSPTETQARTAPALSLVGGNSLDPGARQEVETTGLRPGEVWEEAESAHEPRAAENVFGSDWIEGAEPGLRWLHPPVDFKPQVPALRIAIQHDPGHTLALHLNGSPVSPLNFEGKSQNAARTVALSLWRGVDIVEGDNVLEVVVSDAAGQIVERLERKVHYPGPPVEAELLVEQSRLIADGRTPPVIAVRLLDRFGEPAREGVVGRYAVDAPYRAEIERSVEPRRPDQAVLEGPRYLLNPNGVALLELEPTTRSGEVVLRFLFDDREQEVRAWLKPEQRDWIVVGLGDGTLGYNDTDGNDEALNRLDIDEGLYLDRRIAFFAKGTVLDDWLLTLSYDSERDEDESVLHRTIDPDLHYPLYGDESQQDYEAPSQSKLFARVERESFYAMYGDYDTALNETELSRYDRTFNGLKSGYRGDLLSFNAFGASSSHAFVKDEIRGDGTSGLYHLSRARIVENSEKIRIETRDRFDSHVVIESQPLGRHTDYNIDYGTGTIFFKEPIPHRDRNLNPVFIVVDYEAEDDADEAIVAGGRGALHFFDDAVELGLTTLHEGNEGARGNLYGSDLRLDLGDATRLGLEYARSEREELVGDRDGTAYLAELEHRSELLSARAFFRELRPDFGLGQQSELEAGTRTYGAEAERRLSDRFLLRAEAFRQETLDIEAERDVIEGRLDYTVGRSLAYGGYRFVRQRNEDDSRSVSQQLLAGGALATWNDRLTLRLDSELALGGEDEASDYPTRFVAGADFRLLPEVTLFAEQEFTFGPDQTTADTRAGVTATPWNGGQVKTSLEQQGTENGDRLFANLGLTQRWQVNPRWGLSFDLNRSATLRDPGEKPFDANVPPASGTLNDDFTAVSLGASYELGGRSWSSRIELRDGDIEDKWSVFTGFYQELHEGLGYSVSLELFDTRTQEASESRQADLRLGLAYRPMASRWIFLDRLDLKLQKEEGSEFDFESQRIVNSLVANLTWTRRTQLSLHYAWKYVLDTLETGNERGFTDLTGVELRRDLTDRMDFSVRASLRHSWDADVYESLVGASLGFQVVPNLWVSVGYNLSGYEDSDFSQAEYTARGPFLRFRYKFDQDTIRDLLRRQE